MKIDFQTIIYLLITLVFVIVGALGKKKRPTVSSSDVNQEDPVIAEMEQEGELVRDEYNDLFGLLKGKGQKMMADAESHYDDSNLDVYARQLKDDRESLKDRYTEKVTENREMIIVKEEVPDSPSESFDSPYGGLDVVESIEGVSMIDNSVGIEDIIKFTELGSAGEQASTKSPVDDLLRQFSGKAAIVYSEILKPKYL